jgi:hypothetical protein
MFRLAVVVSLTLFVGGCSGVAEPTFSSGLVLCEGVVTIGGSPAADVEVVFTPASLAGDSSKAIAADKTDTELRSGFATTGPDGRFSLISPPGGVVKDFEKYTGALPGPYVVSFHKFVMQDGSTYTAEMAKTKPPQAAGARDIIPQQYSRPQTSPAKVTVATDGATNLEFKLPAAK